MLSLVLPNENMGWFGAGLVQVFCMSFPGVSNSGRTVISVQRVGSCARAHEILSLCTRSHGDRGRSRGRIDCEGEKGGWRNSKGPIRCYTGLANKDIMHVLCI